MTSDQFLKLTIEEQQLLINALRKDKELYARTVLPHIVSHVPAFHKPIYKSMNDMMERRYKYGAYVMFRGASKSTISKTIGVSHDMVFARENVILLISESIDQASKDLVSIQDELMDNDFLKMLIGDPKGGLWNQEECEMQNGVFVKCRGYGSRIRGLKWKNMRPSKIILDDFESESNSATKLQRTRVAEWIMAQVLPAGDNNPIFQFFGTIVHPEAYLGKLHNLNYFQDPLGFYYRCEVEKGGVPTWPQRFPMSWIESKRQFYKEQGMLSLFLQEYYNIPYSGGVALFDAKRIEPREAYFGHYEHITYLTIDGKKCPVNVFIGVDPARSVRDDADDTAMVTIAMLPDKSYVVLDVFTDKIKPSKQVDKVFELADRFRPKHQEIEVNAYQFALVDWCREQMSNGRLPSFAIEEYTSTQSKNAKYIAGLEPIINGGKVWRLANTPGYDKLEMEMSRFDGERKDNSDNTLDALFLAIDKAYPPPDFNVDDTIEKYKQRKRKTKRKRSWITL